MIQKRVRKPVPASQSRDAARAAHQDTLGREMLYAGILARMWPSFLTVPQREDALYPAVLCIDTPAGRIAYRLRADDLPGFEHVTERRPKDDAPCSLSDKFARLLHLSVEGWS